MHALHQHLASLFGFFLSPGGILLLSALDSTILVSLPFGIDAAVIIVAARSEELAWLTPLIADAGSIAGASLTFWMGRKIGEYGLERWIPARHLHRVKNRVRRSGAWALAALDLVPPPFPFDAFLIASGALDVDAKLFFSTLAATRVIRFGGEALLAWKYGPHIIGWMKTPTFEYTVAVLIVLAILGTVLSIWKVATSTRGRPTAT